MWGWLGNWIGRSFTARDAGSPLYWGAETDSGETVTQHSAMQLSAFWACVRLISQTIATLPLGVFEKDAKTGEKIARSDHPLYRLLHDSPSADQTAVEFWEGRVLGLLTAGNGYAEKKLSDTGRLISLERMPADTIVRRLDNGNLEYRFCEYGKEFVLPEARVFHIRGFGDDYCGMSPVSHARQTLALARATDRAAGQTFSKGMRAKGFFTVPQTLTKDQRDQVTKTLIDPFSGPQGKQWGVLEAGFDFKTVNITPRDAELIMSRKFNVEDICRWFGVPPILVGHAADGQTMWGSGVEQIMLGWLTLGLRPYLNRIEQRIKKSLMTPEDTARGIFAEFNVEGLLRADSAGRAALYASLIQNAVMKPNEARSKENLPHEDGGDQLLINSTLIPLSLAGQPRTATTGSQPAPPANRAALKDVRELKIIDVLEHDKNGRILKIATRKIEEPGGQNRTLQIVSRELAEG